MYKTFIRPVLFKFSPETIHNLVFASFKIASVFPGILKKREIVKDENKSINLWGITFPGRVGLAAGLDKDAEAFDMLGVMGFDFVEIGTVTPKPQPGNPKPRLFRLKKDSALINRMGFNNKGVDYAVEKLKQKKTNIIIGGNIGKNKLTANENAIDDYIICFEKLFDYVDYFAVNVSSPNTPNLRELQEKEPLRNLLQKLQSLNYQKSNPKPILLKIAPDLTNEQLDDIVEIVKDVKLHGIIATNTTIERNAPSYTKDELTAIGAGGLSGKPLKNRSTEVIKYLSQKTEKQVPIIGVGGIFSAQDALEKINAGASLVQLYTSFIYEGPSLIKKINKEIAKNNL